MQVTTQTGETVTLAMPLQFAFEEITNGKGVVFIRAIGRNQWYRVQSFYPGQAPELSYVVLNPALIRQLNAQLP